MKTSTLPPDRLRAMARALEPFAKAYEAFEASTEDAMSYDDALAAMRHAVRLTDFRAAREALRQALPPADVQP